MTMQDRGIVEAARAEVGACAQLMSPATCRTASVHLEALKGKSSISPKRLGLEFDVTTLLFMEDLLRLLALYVRDCNRCNSLESVNDESR